jgi:lipoprotein-releasing system ATP-binding protein
VLKIEGLTKIYELNKKSLVIFENISYDFPFNKTISIVGDSGVGKSTLLHILGTIDNPSKGTVYYDDINVLELSENKLANFRSQHIGFVFQFHHLLPDFTALENVMIPNMIIEKDKTVSEKKAIELLELVGLKDRLKHKPSELSGGEQQRVAIARALINNPKVIFADEPTGNLDEKTSEKIHELLLSIQKKYNSTLIVVTHNEKLAKNFDIRLKLTKGRLINLEENND